jgi:peptidoglycan/LPS O-acetylase OafA/YrhL
VFALLALSPFGEIQDLVHQSWAAIGSVANAWYFADSGYFEASSRARLLLHTWSLSIEEQFYLGFAVVLTIATFIKKKLSKSEPQRKSLAPAVVLLVAAFVFSFVGSVLLSRGVRLTPLPFRFAYLGTPVRAWEFLVGIFTALVPTRVAVSKYRYRIVVSLMISIQALIAVTYSQYTTFPGVQALPIVLTTSTILLVGDKKPTVGSPPFIVRSLSWLGDRSYSLYLWHYPFLTIANLFDLASPTWNVINTTIAVALSVAVSDCSYRYLERPLQRSVAPTRSGATTLAGFVAAVLIFGGSVLVLANTGLGVSRESAFGERTILDASGCVTLADVHKLLDRCDPNSGSGDLVLLVGDSHAAAIYDGVLSATRSQQMSLALISNPGCPFLADPPMGADSCRNLQTETLEAFVILELITAYRREMDRCRAR